MEYIKRDPLYYEMDKNTAPAVTIQSGETVCVQTYDSMTGRIVDETGTKYFGVGGCNPCSGPIYVSDALPGDTLKVEILDIVPQGPCYTTCAPGFGAYADRVMDKVVHMLPIKGNYLIFQNDMQIPVRCMIGTIGVAPKDKAIDTLWPAEHGGNMDNTRIASGSTVYIPVQVEGALLFMGDVHAAMGDGEVMGAGAEVGAEITVRISVVKDKIPCVIVDADNRLYTVASRPTLEECCQEAVWNMACLIGQYKNLSTDEAGMLCSLVGDLHICQIVDPQPTVRFGVDKYYILGDNSKNFL